MEQRGLRPWMAVLCGSLLSISLNSEASGTIGKVTEQTAAVAQILRDKQTLQGNKGAQVEMQDAVKTAQGKLGITFADDTHVQITENSKLIIDDFVYDPKAKTGGKLAVKIALGTARYASGQIAKTNPQNVAVTTPTATIGVRGTDFSATVDELGRSTVILLPSCPPWIKNTSTGNIDKDCKVGEISVASEMGTVILNQAFQATRVDSRMTPPNKPVILKLSEDAISNLLIVAPPKEFDRRDDRTKIDVKSALDVDFLKETGLNVNALDKSTEQLYEDKLSRNLLDNTFLINILDLINAQLAAQLDLLNSTKSGLLPDYFAPSGIIVTVDEPKVTLFRDDGSNVMSVTVPTTQNSVIYMTQGAIPEIKNRVNSGGNSSITLIQK